VIVIILLISFIADGASWDAIDTLLGLGLLAFLFFRWISTYGGRHTTFAYFYLNSAPFGYSFAYKNANIDTVSVNISVLVFMPESYLKPEFTKTVRFVTIEVDLKYKGVLCYERACSQIIKRAD